MKPPGQDEAGVVVHDGDQVVVAPARRPDYTSSTNFRAKVLDFVQLGGLGGSPRVQFDRSHRALRRSHHGSCHSRGGPYEFVAVPLFVVANSLALPFDGRLWLCVLACPTHCTNTRTCSTILTCATKTVPGCTVRCSIWPSVQCCIQDSY